MAVIYDRYSLAQVVYGFTTEIDCDNLDEDGNLPQLVYGRSGTSHEELASMGREALQNEYPDTEVSILHVDPFGEVLHLWKY